MSDTDLDRRDAGLPAPDARPAIAAPKPGLAELPMPESVKDGEKVVDTLFKAHRSRVDAARRALAQAEKAHQASIKQAQLDREQAARPAKIAAIGIVRTVTLTETTIKTPTGEFPLTPDVEARAEQHGNKQVVQGWIFKSDNDRREIYLHLHGPDWADVVPFPMKYASMQPKDLHEFAAKVGVAARNSDRARAALDERVRAAEQHLWAITADRAGIEAAAEAFVAAAWDVRELRPATKNLEQLLAHAEPGDRKVRKAAEALADVQTKVKDFFGEAESARHRIHQTTAALPQLPAMEPGQLLPAGAANVTLMAAGPKPIHVIKILRAATGASLKNAKQLVDRAPTMILANADPAPAATLRSSLEQVGASVVLEPVDAPEPVEPDSPATAAVTPPAAGDPPAESSRSPSAAGTPDVFDQIRRLGELRESGLITTDEFDAKKAELLARL
jgi:ribosomal protein L7/L12